MPPKRDRISDIAKTIGPVQTATLVRSIPNPSAFTFELKWDGYRIVAIKAGGAVRLVSRRSQDYSAEFRGVVKDVATLDVDECALDGEVCALDERGVPSFQLLQNRQRRKSAIAFFVFDLLWVDGVERPNRVVFDLDPAPDVTWKDVARAARLVRDRLDALGLESFVKTTGGKGLHVVVPLDTDADWDETPCAARPVPVSAAGTAAATPRRGRGHHHHPRVPRGRRAGALPPLYELRELIGQRQRSR